MAHIIEPEEIDFLIKSPPLTEQERIEISEFIKSHKKEWKSFSKKEQKDIEDAILELDSEHGIKHEDIISKYRKIYSNA
jgi:hypothetical protein